VRQLLAFSRGRCEKRGVVAVDVLIGSVERLLQSAMPPGIRVRVSLPRELWAVHADATQMRQVLLNLCLNARDAMPEGGLLEIRAEDVELDCGTRSMEGEARGGRHVRISVADTGAGIPPQILGKIFEPFFTTKGAAKGTGLGLVNVAGIVKSHGGFVTVDTELGVGTAFHVHLPALVRADQSAEALPIANSPAHGGGERILLIDDDAGVGATLDLMLATRGYQVSVVDSGEAGVRMLSQKPDYFQLVMTDLHLGGMSGIDVLERLRSLRLPPRVIVMSGLRREAQALPDFLDGVEYIDKPTTMDNLLAVVRRVLDEPRDETIRRGNPQPNGAHPARPQILSS
jgi:CheY-like chemotaxis protein